MKKPIDETAVRLGTAMKVARNACHVSPDDTASLLRIMPSELAEYERGISQMPTDIIQRVFISGYEMMRFRTLDRRYRKLRHMMHKVRQASTQAFLSAQE